MVRLEFIFVLGIIVFNVILYNVFDLRDWGIWVGDVVIFWRVGDVIFEIIGVLKEVCKSYLFNFYMFKVCFVCGGRVVRMYGEWEYCCINLFNCKV